MWGPAGLPLSLLSLLSSSQKISPTLQGGEGRGTSKLGAGNKGSQGGKEREVGEKPGQQKGGGEGGGCDRWREGRGHEGSTHPSPSHPEVGPPPQAPHTLRWGPKVHSWLYSAVLPSSRGWGGGVGRRQGQSRKTLDSLASGWCGGLRSQTRPGPRCPPHPESPTPGGNCSPALSAAAAPSAPLPLPAPRY